MILTMELATAAILPTARRAISRGGSTRSCIRGRQDSKESTTINWPSWRRIASPKMITAEASAYPRIIDFQKMREIADSVGALLFVDMAHIAGLVAAGLHPSPVPWVISSPRPRTSVARAARGLTVQSEIRQGHRQLGVPGIRRPLMHIIAAKAVCFLEAMKPDFKEYQRQIVKNAKALATALAATVSASSAAGRTII